MPELRKNPVSGEWVIISPERGKRKFDFTSKTEEKKILECSFCEGHEDETPSEVFSIRKKGTKPDSPGWWIRVVPNKYPALSIGGKPDIEKNGTPASPATARASKVFPDPGGPNNKAPFGILPPRR